MGEVIDAIAEIASLYENQGVLLCETRDFVMTSMRHEGGFHVYSSWKFEPTDKMFLNSRWEFETATEAATEFLTRLAAVNEVKRMVREVREAANGEKERTEAGTGAAAANEADVGG